MSDNEYDADEIQVTGTQEDYRKFQSNRNETMFAIQESKYQQKKTDFDVNNYDVEELAAILNFKYVPLNEGLIRDRIKDMKQRFKNKAVYLKFFTDVEVKLVKNLKLFNKQTWKDVYTHDDSSAAQALANQYQEKLKEDIENNNNQMLLPEDELNVVIGRPKVDARAERENIQGTINANKIYTYERIINFDSTFRQILPSTSHSCGGGTVTVDETNSEDRLYSATNYIAHLSEPLTNVVNIEVKSVEIPKTWYVFSENYGTTSFQVETPTKKITLTIEEGNYNLISGDENNLITVLNNAISVHNDLSKNDVGTDMAIEFVYKSNKQKVDIINRFRQDISLNWYIPDIAGSCGGNGAGSKVDYNLGWLLGFRTTFTLIPGLSTYNNIYGQSLVDVNGTTYLFITLDDFNNNKPSNVVIAAAEPVTSGFSLPSYYNDQTMNTKFGRGTYYPGRDGEPGYECVDVADEDNNERGCGTADLNTDLRSNLTQKQEFSVNQLLQAQGESSADRYGSPEPTDLLYTINDLDRVDWNTTLSYTNTEGENQRRYFGPVKLTKFKIRLVNNKGFDVDLNGRDWSFKLKVTQQYQY
tara:strand:- start:3286 stop:5040 length:1755 start_codon:yes stop_codon:yes gene_type:complete